jgi:hypothetical protein
MPKITTTCLPGTYSYNLCRDQSRTNWKWNHDGIANINSRPIETLVQWDFSPSIVRGTNVFHVGGGWTVRGNKVCHGGYGPRTDLHLPMTISSNSRSTVWLPVCGRVSRKIIIQVHQLLKPFKNAQLLLEGDQYVTLSLLPHAVKAIRVALLNIVGAPGDGEAQTRVKV